MLLLYQYETPSVQFKYYTFVHLNNIKLSSRVNINHQMYQSYSKLYPADPHCVIRIDHQQY